jgi:hypothetical protein
MGSVWRKASGLCDFGGITFAEGLRDWGGGGVAGRAPFELHPAICLTTDEKPQSG